MKQSKNVEKNKLEILNTKSEKEFSNLSLEDQIELFAEILIDQIINDIYEKDRNKGIATGSNFTK